MLRVRLQTEDRRISSVLRGPTSRAILMSLVALAAFAAADQVDPTAYAGRPEALHRALRRTAARSQADLVDLVNGAPR